MDFILFCYLGTLCAMDHHSCDEKRLDDLGKQKKGSGSFQISDIGMALVMALGWGIPFYLLFFLMMKVSEKKADKIVEEKEENNEE